MLTGRLVRVRYARDRVVPCWVNAADTALLEMAERLREVFGSREGATRAELEEELSQLTETGTTQILHQGLVKLLEDRCEFEVASSHPPEALREQVFAAAAAQRRARRAALDPAGAVEVVRPGFDRGAVLGQVGTSLGLSPDQVDRGLFADLKSEQRLVRFKDLSAERLLHRYNVALAQAVLLRSTAVRVHLSGATPQRLRQLFRLVKFHRLVCEIQDTGSVSCRLQLDGPLSLFSATQKYGLQLALFLPAVLLCQDFELEADLRWGAQRKAKKFKLTSTDGLVSHYPDVGSYVPPELKLFTELFRKKISDWEIEEETAIFPMDRHFWVPDYRLVHRASGRVVYFEVLGFWRRAGAEQHLARLRQHAGAPFVLAVSDQLRLEDADLETLPGGIHRFRNMPLPDEVVRLAAQQLAL
jgi:predicted nuclease of restriction endonuclease-like RecB superfamily